MPERGTTLRLLAGFLVIASFALLLMESWSSFRVNAVSFYAQALAAVAEVRVVTDAPYAVRHGVVYEGDTVVSGAAALPPLQTAYEKVVAMRRPLIALPGVEPQRFLDAVSLLEETQRILAKRQTTPQNTALVSHALFPIDFLRAAGELEQLRLRFIQSGSARDALAYRTEVQEVMRLYRADLARFEAAFDEAVPKDVSRYATQKDLISRADALNALKRLDAAVIETQREVDLRERCFEGVAHACAPSTAAIPLPTAPETPVVTAAARALVAETRQLSAEAGVQIAPLTDPLYQLAESKCITPRPQMALLYTFRLMHTPTGTPEYTSPLTVGDIRFVESAQYAKLPFYKYFAEHGIRYVVSGKLTYYACPETAYDQGTVIALKDIRDLALQKKLSARADAPLASTLRRFEETFATASIITETDAVNYLRAALALAESGRVSESDAAAIYTLALEYTDKAPGVLQTMLDISSFEQNNMRISALGADIDFSALYLFFVRSAFPSLYLTSNPSATGAFGAAFPRNTLSDADEPYRYYSDLVKTPGIKEELIKDLAFYQHLHFDQ